ncbi:MAG: CheR family methyltransferase [Gemmatimonadaceae bacterium]
MSSARSTSPGFEDILDLLKARRGFDFSGYKRASLMRRVRRRMQTVGVEAYGDYIELLERDPAEFDRLFNTILINVTTFFRDGVPWQFLSEDIVPRILEQRAGSQPIRVWSAGCASGQEPYTLAMVLAESMGIDEFLRRVKIYATDLDDEALSYARHGVYTAKEIGPVPELLRERYFDEQRGSYSFKKSLRRCVIFGRNDLIDDAPISRIDLLVCRNTLMYFDARTQERILNRFRFALRDGGFLFLGKAETLATYSTVFTPVDLQRRVFVKTGDGRRAVPPTVGARDRDAATAQDDTENDAAVMSAAFESSALAQFVVDRDGRLAVANDRARSLFRLNVRDVGRPLRDLEVSYRPVELRSLIDQIRLDGRSVKMPETPWPQAGEDRWFDVQLVPLVDARGILVGVSVSFEDVTLNRRLKLELQQSSAELETAYEELQSSNEELETTNEELQSTVEELETTNEELQSTNEELETMNEELQSTNEELGAINDQLGRRGAQVDELNEYLRSIVASLRGGVAVLDRGLRVKVWSRRAEDLWGVRAAEAMNAHLGELDIGLPLAEVTPLIEATLAKLERTEERTIVATNRRGKRIECRVAASPLIGPDHQGVQGVILTMEDTTGGLAD